MCALTSGLACDCQVLGMHVKASFVGDAGVDVSLILISQHQSLDPFALEPSADGQGRRCTDDMGHHIVAFLTAHRGGSRHGTRTNLPFDLDTHRPQPHSHQFTHLTARKSRRQHARQNLLHSAPLIVGMTLEGCLSFPLQRQTVSIATQHNTTHRTAATAWILTKSRSTVPPSAHTTT